MYYSQYRSRYTLLAIAAATFFFLCGYFFASKYKKNDCLLEINNNVQQIETPYGKIDVAEPVLIELLNCSAIQRIKNVRQYGIRSIVDGYGDKYTRYEHCVGVWALLRMHGASLEEQIAGLLHDASHTVFSHVGDFLFKQADCQKSYQDDIHDNFLEKMGVDKIVNKYGLRLEDVVPKDGIHVALDQSLPDICADRLEYNIQEGLLAGILNKEDVLNILANVKFEKGKWFFTDVASAAKLAKASLHGTRFIWGGPMSYVMDTLTAKALRRSIELGIITMDDIHYSVDDVVWNKVCQSNDQEIADLTKKIKNSKNIFYMADKDNHDVFVRSKFRGINPLVRACDGSLKRLTELDSSFAHDYENIKKQIAQGWYISFYVDEKTNDVVEGLSPALA